MTLKICIAQLNFVVGDLAGNAQKIIDASRTAYDEGDTGPIAFGNAGAAGTAQVIIARVWC